MIDSSGLPSTWARATLGDLASPSSEKVDPGSAGGMPYVGLEHIESGTRRLLGHGVARDVRSTKSMFRRGDVLYGKLRPYLRKVWLAEFDGVCSTDILVYSRSETVDSGFLAYLLSTHELTNHAVASSAGINLPRVNARALSEFKVRLPPLGEQRRIAAKLDALLASSRAVRAALNAVPALLEHYRQAALAAAFRGDLTADWRRLQSEPEPQTTASTEDDSTAADDLPALPSSWRYRLLEGVAEAGTVVTYGIVLPGPEVPDGVPYVRQQDIEGGRIRVAELAHTSRAIAAKYERSALRQGDVLLCIIRHLRVAIVPPGIDGANVTQGTVRIRPASFISSAYLAAYLSAPAAQAWMKRCYIGMAMPRINVKDARAVPIAVPPLGEQLEITRRVRDALNIVEAQFKTVDELTNMLDQLEQATLAKAFRGELIPQDPTVEASSRPRERAVPDRGASPRNRRKVGGR